MSDEQQRRAEEARRILDSDVFRTAIAEVELGFMNEWRNTRPEEVDARERIHTAVNVLEEVRTQLRIVIEAGAISQNRLVKIKNWHSPNQSKRG